MSITLTINDSLQISPRVSVGAGDLVKVKGKSGSFTFRRHVVTDRGKEWVDVISTDMQFHSVRPDEVKHIPRKRKKG